MNCFKDVINPPSREDKPRKTGIGVGHSESDKGADNKEWYVKTASYDPEYDEWVKEYDMDGDRKLEEYELSVVAARISTLAWADRNEGRGRAGMCEELAEQDCTEAIFLHANSYNGHASGFEVWYNAYEPESKKFAKRLLDAYAAEFPHLENRGLKRATKKSRAYGVMKYAAREGILEHALLEKYFIDVRSDFIPPEKIGQFLRKFGQK